MQPSTIKVMVISVVCGIILLFGLNVLTRLGHFDVALANPVVVQVASIKNISVEQNGDVKVLSSKDAELVGRILSTLKPVHAKLYPIKDPSIPISKVILKNYDGTEVILTPLAFEGRDLVFSLPASSDKEYYIESSAGELYRLLKANAPVPPSEK